MTTFKNYLSYRLKNTLLQTVVLSVLSIIIALLSVNTYYDFTNTIREGFDCLLFSISFCATIIPFTETSAFKNKRNLDVYYSLPIGRQKLALTHFLSGIIQITIIYTISFVTVLLLLLSEINTVQTGYLLLFYPLSLLLGFIIYSFFIFVFSKATTVLDGIITSCLWLEAAWISANAFRIFSSQLIGGFHWGNSYYQLIYDITEWLHIYSPIDNLTTLFYCKVLGRSTTFDLVGVESIVKYFFVMFPVIAGVGILSAFGFIRGFKNTRAERIGDISNSWFSYKLLIPLYAFSLIMIAGSSIITSTFIVISAFIGYVIYRRGFKFKKSDIIILASLVIYAILISYSYNNSFRIY